MKTKSVAGEPVEPSEAVLTDTRYVIMGLAVGLLFVIVSVPVSACWNPCYGGCPGGCGPCSTCVCTTCVPIDCGTGNCKSCVNGACVVCGGDPNQGCCNGTCYNKTTQTCCGGQIKNKGNCMACINDVWKSTCDPNLCQDCNATTDSCQSRCDSSKCETCVNNQCLPCGGDPNKCCDRPEVGPPGCVPKCVNNAATCQWDPPNDYLVQCQNFDPEDKSCEEIVLGQICSHRIVYRIGTAKCADCYPNCATTRVESCATIYPIRCKNETSMWIFTYCECTDEGAPSYSGAAYDCVN